MPCRMASTISQQCRLGQCWHEQRHRGLRGADDPPLVARCRPASLSGAKRLTITADGGGSNGSRVRLWKRELQRLADELGIDIVVHHLPPGTSKWNKIEHRLFSFITMNWRAQPLVSYRVIVDLIGATPPRHGLTVRCELDTNTSIQRESSSPTRRWPPSTSPATPSTASGTTPSIPQRTQSEQLTPDEP